MTDSPASNIRHLTDVDADANMPLDDNFAYYTTHDFHNNYDISQCFPNKQSFLIVNCNVRSLSKNYDNFTNMLSNLYHPFSLIGLSETKITSDRPPITNIDHPGYHFVSQPTLSDWGGVGFYIKNSLRYKIRPELSAATEDYESLWIEVQNLMLALILSVVLFIGTLMVT